jgi:carboxyl-terminal processing protease
VIPANFEDDLADVPTSHRAQIVRLYKFNLQPIMHNFTSYLDILKKNSTMRIEQNKNYQNFIKEISKKDLSSEKVENFGLSDLQLTEASNILKDLILLMQETQPAHQIETPPAA